MLVMIAGPYTSGNADAARRAENFRRLNEAALAVFQRGHIPVVGVNAALPVIDVAGAEHFEAIMMPVSLALAERCDACLRVGGPSQGADEEVQRFLKRGLTVYTEIDDVPFA